MEINEKIDKLLNDAKIIKLDNFRSPKSSRKQIVDWAISSLMLYLKDADPDTFTMDNFIKHSKMIKKAFDKQLKYNKEK
jgi:hypothetical protein